MYTNPIIPTSCQFIKTEPIKLLKNKYEIKKIFTINFITH